MAHGAQVRRFAWLRKKTRPLSMKKEDEGLICNHKNGAKAAGREVPVRNTKGDISSYNKAAPAFWERRGAAKRTGGESHG